MSIKEWLGKRKDLAEAEVVIKTMAEALRNCIWSLERRGEYGRLDAILDARNALEKAGEPLE